MKNISGRRHSARLVSRGWAGLWILVAGTLQTAVGAEIPAGAPVLQLRMDHRLATPEARNTTGESSLLQAFGLAEFKDRVGSLQRQAEWQNQANASLAQHISERERHIADLRELLDVQSHVETVLEAPRPALRAPQQEAPRLARASTAAWPVEVPSTGYGLEKLTYQSAMLFILAVLLSLFLYVRSRIVSGRLSAVDKELKHIIHESDGAAGEVTQEMMAIVRKKARAATKTRKGRNGSVPRVPTDFPEPKRANGKSNPIASRLREVDTLLAFEDYEQAARVLNELVAEFPENPEVRLRLLHVQSAAGDEDATRAEERVLSAMMEGPLSDTIKRVRRVGKEMLPHHPLFKKHLAEKAERADTHSRPFDPTLETIRIDPARSETRH